jgi:hypothetical protein
MTRCAWVICSLAVLAALVRGDAGKTYTVKFRNEAQGDVFLKDCQVREKTEFLLEDSDGKVVQDKETVTGESFTYREPGLGLGRVDGQATRSSDVRASGPT